MSEHEGVFAPGTPCWSDLGVDDVSAARAFYTEVFGWELQDGPPEAGGYLMALLDGRPVAGIGPRTGSGRPSAWTSYLATEDADATAAAVTHAGGSVLTPPFDVMDVGRMAIATDTTGVVFGLWQGYAHQGYGRVNEAGAACWNETHTTDAESSRAFYAAVFGYRFEVFGDPSEPYAIAKLPDADADADPVAGVFAPPTGLPDGVPGYWITWYGARDTDATVAAVLERGGTALMEPSDSPFGRSALVLGAQGELFGVIAVPSP
ncbi:VOC family protein [Curtobacterium pusillum]|uniref:VOC family protein n=1 Tax=Curtobacterium pusillum TaxID=69373 RepID=A0ABX2M4J1_9MICO|nr:VOC family protein [Curtobacterium pusillum]NUU12796.1 VOC family protein [Curtobacterium pusillum]GLK30007.1 glyoxalase [Curtobacterium pusillum]